MASAVRSKSQTFPPAEANAVLQGALALLEQGRYEQVAEILWKAHLISEQHGNAIVADILSATWQICLACSKFRDETDRHRREQEEALDREMELRRQIHALLDLTCGNQMTIPGSDAPPNDSRRGDQSPPPPSNTTSGPSSESSREHSLWQRLQNLVLDWKANLPDEQPAIVWQAAAPAPDIHRESGHMTDVMPAASSASSSLQFFCLGKFRVYRNGQRITQWNSLKGLSILKYLVAHHETPISKDMLMDVFWPDADPESARRNLHQAIYSLRQTLRRGAPDFQPIQFENECYLLSGELHLRLDFEEFVQYAQAGRQLEAQARPEEAASIYQRAEEMYLGDFLEEDVYEDWTGLMREQYRSLYLDLTDRLSEFYRLQSNYAAAIEVCQKILARDSCNEQAHRRLMQCFQNQGQRGLAIRQYRLCVETLKSDLEVSPAMETQSLFEKIAGRSGGANLLAG